MKTRRPAKISSVLTGAFLFTALATLTAHAQSYPTVLEALKPIDYWRLTETAPSPAPDIISNLGSAGPAGNGYAVLGALTGQPGGIVGNCVQLFNPGDNGLALDSRIDIPNLAALNPVPPFSIEFWAKPTSLYVDTTGLCVISSDSPFPGLTSRSGYLFYLNSGAWTFRLGGENGYTATATWTGSPASNVWTHIVGEFDGTNATIYINGVLAGSATASVSSPYDENHYTPTRIGGTALSGTSYGGDAVYDVGNRGYDGYLDEFAVYNTLLSSNTILSHYTAGVSNPTGYDALIMASHPVGYWNMDEPAYVTPSVPGTFANDIGSLVDDGTNTLGSLAGQPGVPGLSTGDASVYYGGAMGSLVLDTNVAQPSFAGLPITLAAWINPNSFGYMEDIIAQGYDETTFSENFLRVGDVFDWEYYSPDNSYGNNNTNVAPDVDYYEIGTYDGGAAYNTAVFPAPPGDLGHWVFLAGTYDGTNWNLYRNGNLVSQFTDDGSGPSLLGLPWSVGSRSSPDLHFGMFFDGSIEEAAIFTNALDAGTISNLYASVALAPVITEAPTAPSPAFLGSAATFSVWADGTPPLSYQWTSNGVPIVGQTGTNLALAGLTGKYSATYAVVVTNTYGAVTTAVDLVVTPTLPPATLAPAEETRWLGFPLSFAPSSLPNQQLAFQWFTNGTAIPGATQSAYSAPALADTAGSYTLVISNTFGAATSSVSTLTVQTPPAGYASVILADKPLSYFRLDETSGSVAYDYAGGNNGNYYGSGLEFKQPGFSLIDTDYAVAFPGVTDNYIGDIGASSIDFSGLNPSFAIEAWANGPSGQTDGAAVVAKGEGNNGGNANEQFALAVSGGNYRFFVRDPSTAHAISEADAKTGPDGNWHYLAGVCDGGAGTVSLYIDGVLAGSAGFPAAGVLESQAPVGIGAERSGVQPPYDWPYNGTIDEVAIYSNALTAAQVFSHYAAAYGTNLLPFVTLEAVSATNYVNLPVSFLVNAAGTVPLTYQWNKVSGAAPLGPIAGQTVNTFSIANLALTDGGVYNCGITNSVGGIFSSNFTITVLPAPTNPPPIGGLVMHLTFDGDLTDATGRGNDATNEASGGATLDTSSYVPGQIGQAFSYQTTLDGSNVQANYASVGVRPDLQFGTNSFTVSMWIQLPANYIGDDLPFFTDVIGSTFGHPGFCFEPSYGTTVGTTLGWAGGWGFSVYDASNTGLGYYGDKDLINDGFWHNLIYIIDRLKGVTVFVDGMVAHQNVPPGGTAGSIIGVGNINSTNAATIGQDPTGLYAESSDGSINIDDLGVWNRALTPLEAAAIFTAGVNQVSFAGVTNAASTITLSAANLENGKVELTWSAGSLEAATNLLGPWVTLTNVTSPFTTNTVGPMQFFRAEQ